MTFAAFGIAAVTFAAVAAFWLGWAPQGRRVLPADRQSRPVERA